MNDIWSCKGPDGVPHAGRELLLQELAVALGVALDAVHQRNIGVDALALDGVVVANNGRLGTSRVGPERILDLGRANAVAADIDDIVHPSSAVTRMRGDEQRVQIHRFGG